MSYVLNCIIFPKIAQEKNYMALADVAEKVQIAIRDIIRFSTMAIMSHESLTLFGQIEDVEVIKLSFVA